MGVKVPVLHLLPLTPGEEEILGPSGWGVGATADTILPRKGRGTSLPLLTWPPLTLMGWPGSPWPVVKAPTLSRLPLTPPQQRGERYFINSLFLGMWNPGFSHHLHRQCKRDMPHSQHLAGMKFWLSSWASPPWAQQKQWESGYTWWGWKSWLSTQSFLT